MLRDLRNAHELMQQRMAEALHISQDGVSPIEKRSDVLLSTLRSNVETMGCKLHLIVEFHNCKPVTVAGLDSLITRENMPRRNRKVSDERIGIGNSKNTSILGRNRDVRNS